MEWNKDSHNQAYYDIRQKEKDPSKATDVSPKDSLPVPTSALPPPQYSGLNHQSHQSGLNPQPGLNPGLNPQPGLHQSPGVPQSGLHHSPGVPQSHLAHGSHLPAASNQNILGVPVYANPNAYPYPIYPVYPEYRDANYYQHPVANDSGLSAKPSYATGTTPGDTKKKRSPTKSPDENSHPKPAPKRSRLGCTTCRQRKKRCCETKPRCTECTRLKLNCIWPAPGSEHKNKSKELKEEENVIYHEVYGKIKVLRGIVEYKSDEAPVTNEFEL